MGGILILYCSLKYTKLILTSKLLSWLDIFFVI